MARDGMTTLELDDHYLHPLTDPGDRERLTVLVKGEGVYVEDETGRRYIDGLAGLWNVSLGHGRTELADAAAQQMRQLAFANTYSGFGNPPALELAARLEELAYSGLKASFFAPSGVDANEAAFKTARYYWRRQGKPEKVKVLSLQWGYHGATLAGMSATGMSDYARMFQPRLAEFVHVPSHYSYATSPVRASAWGRPPPACWRRRSSARARRPSRPSSSSRCRGRVGSSFRPTTTSRASARSWTVAKCSSSPTRSSRASAGRASGSASVTGVSSRTS